MLYAEDLSLGFGGGACLILRVCWGCCWYTESGSSVA